MLITREIYVACEITNEKEWSARRRDLVDKLRNHRRTKLRHHRINIYFSFLLTLPPCSFLTHTNITINNIRIYTKPDRINNNPITPYPLQISVQINAAHSDRRVFSDTLRMNALRDEIEHDGWSGGGGRKWGERDRGKSAPVDRLKWNKKQWFTSYISHLKKSQCIDCFIHCSLIRNSLYSILYWKDS